MNEAQLDALDTVRLEHKNESFALSPHSPPNGGLQPHRKLKLVKRGHRELLEPLASVWDMF